MPVDRPASSTAPTPGSPAAANLAGWALPPPPRKPLPKPAAAPKKPPAAPVKSKKRSFFGSIVHTAGSVTKKIAHKAAAVAKPIAPLVEPDAKLIASAVAPLVKPIGHGVAADSKAIAQTVAPVMRPVVRQVVADSRATGHSFVTAAGTVAGGAKATIHWTSEGSRLSSFGAAAMGGLEVAGGVSLGLTLGWTGVGAVAAGLVIADGTQRTAHGIVDGIRNKQAEGWEAQALQKLGVGGNTSRHIDNLTGLVGGLAGGLGELKVAGKGLIALRASNLLTRGTVTTARAVANTALMADGGASGAVAASGRKRVGFISSTPLATRALETTGMSAGWANAVQMGAPIVPGVAKLGATRLSDRFGTTAVAKAVSEESPTAAADATAHSAPRDPGSNSEPPHRADATVPASLRTTPHTPVPSDKSPARTAQAHTSGEAATSGSPRPTQPSSVQPVLRVRPSQAPRLETTQDVSGALRQLTPRSTAIASAMDDGRITLHLMGSEDFNKALGTPDGRVMSFSRGTHIYLDKSNSNSWERLLGAAHEGSHALDAAEGPDAGTVADAEGRAYHTQMGVAQAVGLDSTPHPAGIGTPVGAHIVNASHTVDDVAAHVSQSYPARETRIPSSAELASAGSATRFDQRRIDAGDPRQTLALRPGDNGAIERRPASVRVVTAFMRSAKNPTGAILDKKYDKIALASELASLDKQMARADADRGKLQSRRDTRGAAGKPVSDADARIAHIDETLLQQRARHATVHGRLQQILSAEDEAQRTRARLADVVHGQSKLHIEAAADDTIDNTEAIGRASVERSALERKLDDMPRPGRAAYRTDPSLLQQMAMPRIPKEVVGDPHTHMYGYDFRAASPQDRRQAAALNLELHGRSNTLVNRSIERARARVWTTFGMPKMVDMIPDSARVMIGNIPQFCGESHYSHPSSPQLTMRRSVRMDTELGEQVQRQWQLHEAAQASGDTEGAAAIRRRMAKLDLSATGVVPGSDPVSYLQQLSTRFPGVFKFVGEFTIQKEQVTAHLGNEAFSLSQGTFHDLLGAAEHNGMGLLIHNDWGHPEINTTDSRINAAKMGYENVPELVSALRQHPNASVVLAHTGIGRLVRPDNQLDANLLPMHMAQLQKLADASPKVRFDISWNDVAEALTTDPALLHATADFIVANPDRVMHGSDTVKPVNDGMYNQSLQSVSPLLSEVAYRDKESAWKLLRGNYDATMDETDRRTQAWTASELAERGRKDDVTLMQGRHALMQSERSAMQTLARGAFDRWHDELRDSPWWQARDAAQSAPTPQGKYDALIQALGGTPSSAYRDAYDALPAARHREAGGEPYGAGTSHGAKPGAFQKARAVGRFVAGGAAAQAGAHVAINAAQALASAHGGGWTSAVGADLANQSAFASRSMLTLLRSNYTDDVRTKMENLVEDGRFSDKGLDDIVARVTSTAKSFDVDPSRLETLAEVTEQFRHDFKQLDARGQAGELSDEQLWHAGMGEIGRWQINVDRALGGIQSAGMNQLDARTLRGRLFRGMVAATYGINTDATARYFMSAAGHHPADPAFWMHAFFGGGNAAMMTHTLSGWASGKMGRAWDVQSSAMRKTQAAGLSLLTGGSAAWTASDALMAVQAGLAHSPAAAALHAGMAGLDALLTRALAVSAETELRRVGRAPMPAPADMTASANRLSTTLAARVGLGIGVSVAGAALASRPAQQRQPDESRRMPARVTRTSGTTSAPRAVPPPQPAQPAQPPQPAQATQAAPALH